MRYLEDIPKNANDYGLNKVLTVRRLTIDFKHRDTEMFIRSPELLEGVDLKELMTFRSRQLRSIHHLSRSVFKTREPQELASNFSTRCMKDMCHVAGTIYLNFQYLLEGFKYDTLDTNKVVVYSENIPEHAMMKFFIKHSLTAPKAIRHSKISDLINYHQVSTVIAYKTTTHTDRLHLWLRNVHVFVMHGEAIETVGYKTDKKI